MPIFTPEVVESLMQFGVGSLFFIAFLILLRWVLNQQSKIMDTHNKEREQWQEIFRTVNETMKDKMVESKSFYEQSKEADRYQRAEHERIMTGLTETILILKSLNGKG